MGAIVQVPLSALTQAGIEADYAFVFTGDPTWKERANCRGRADLIDVIFFPKVRGKATKLQEDIESVCGDCPVKSDCYQFGIESGAKEGVWGGVWFRRSRAKGK